MCGIAGYIGKQQAAPIILDGLSKLEYRGYDSAGIAVFDGQKIHMEKAVGRLRVLDEKIRPRCIAARFLRYRTHPLGDAWLSLRHKCPSPYERGAYHCCRPQRHHRKL